MKIAIDARWIFREISGIGAYTRELIAALARMDRRNRYVLLFDDPALRDRTLDETGLRGAPNVADLGIPCGVFSLRNQVLLPSVLAREGIDLFHAPNYLIPFLAFPRRRRRRQTRCVVTVHDVIPMVLRDHAPRSRKSRLYPLYRRLMVEVGARADAIVTVSRRAADDIVRHLRIPPGSAAKVHPIYCGIPERFHAAGRRRQAAEPMPGEPRNVLYVGRLDPYKNVPTLLRAFAAVRGQCPFPVALTVAGAPDPRYPEARRVADALGLGPAVRWTGYVSDEQLLDLYCRAAVLVHPSRYEGFGLQVLEAMACGTPVVCSNAGSLPEVTGGAAILVGPDDVDGFTGAIAAVLSNAPTARRMSEAGRRRAAEFTWDRAAAETLALYETVGGAGAPRGAA